MKRFFAFVVLALSIGESGAVLAEELNTGVPMSNPPSAVSNRLGGAAIKPAPGAKPVDGVVIPPLNPGAGAPQNRNERRP